VVDRRVVCPPPKQLAHNEAVSAELGSGARVARQPSWRKILQLFGQFIAAFCYVCVGKQLILFYLKFNLKGNFIWQLYKSNGSEARLCCLGPILLFKDGPRQLLYYIYYLE
jgi:hypothetical protein